MAFAPEIDAEQAAIAAGHEQDRADDQHQKDLKLAKAQPKPASNTK